MHHLNSNEMIKAKARWELHKNAAGYFEQILETVPQELTKRYGQ